MFGWVSEIDRLKLRPENETAEVAHDENQAHTITMSSVSSFASTSEEGEGGSMPVFTRQGFVMLYVVVLCSCRCTIVACAGWSAYVG